MKSNFKFFCFQAVGMLMASVGLAIYLWLYLYAETTGSGLQLKIIVIGESIPAMIPVLSGLFISIYGFAIFYISKYKR